MFFKPYESFSRAALKLFRKIRATKENLFSCNIFNLENLIDYEFSKYKGTLFKIVSCLEGFKLSFPS